VDNSGAKGVDMAEYSPPKMDRITGKWPDNIGFLWASNQFASGLIHELTNHATASLALVDSIEESTSASAIAELATQLGKSVRVCGRLIAQSQRIIENTSSPVTNLNEVAEVAVRLLRHVINRNVQLEARLDPTVDGLRVMVPELETVLAVLLVRAREVLKGEGSVAVETGYTQLDAPRRTRLAKLEAREYATLSLTCSNEEDSDQGWEQWFQGQRDEDAGMPPFSFVQSLLDVMEAQIDVALRPYFGATVTVYFPVVAIDVPVKRDELEAGRWHILVVEDDPVLGEGIREALERRGFKITTFNSAEQALAKFPDGTGIDMLVTDIVLGRMSGWDLARRLQEERPELAVVFTSGYSTATGFDPNKLPPNTSFLAKPFEISQLLKHIRATFSDAEFSS
jgi:two-component system cell cycle sensor histidine kinase/response regulator CckA